MIEREEFKFPFEANDGFEVRRFLSNLSMRPTYEMRTINSLYFDDETFDAHNLGEEGIVPRHKIRLRWYGDKQADLMDSILEVKSTFATHRTKRFIPFGSLLGLVQDHYFMPIRQKIRNRELRPTVLVTYKRCYFQNPAGMRATLDYGIHYSRCTLDQDYKLTILNQTIERANVLEAKGETQKCRQMILKSRLTWMRFSKYSRAINALT